MFGENFPYTNFHELNMDWIIKIAKDFLDQYSHIQQTITEGLEDLDAKAEELQAHLDAWYETHSEDIANQLASALQDLNDWYTTHENYLDSTLASNIAAFNLAAENKAQDTIASIPASYTDLSNEVSAVRKLNSFNAMDNLNIPDSSTNHGITYVHNADGTFHISGTPDSTSYGIIYSSQNAIPSDIIPGRKYFLDVKNNATVDVQVYLYMAGATPSQHSFTSNSNVEFVVPYNCTGIIIRFRYSGTGAINLPDVSVNLYAASPYTDGSRLYSNGTGDRTDEIFMILQEYGICNLGVGDFYIHELVMPEGTSLVGCGAKTVIHVLGDNYPESHVHTYGIQISKHNTLKNFTLTGDAPSISVDTLGYKTGIVFIANHDGTGGAAYDSEHCNIENINILEFSEYGIRCENTTINYARSAFISGCFIDSCHIGLIMQNYSEFNKVTNSSITKCWYACCNHSGNNVFVNCTFQATNTAFYMDGNYPNAGHGIIDSCSFCHTGSNGEEGRALYIIRITYGFIVSNCQFWYNRIHIASSNGIQLNGCEFGRSQHFLIVGGTSFINGCTFQNDGTYPPGFSQVASPSIVITNSYGTDSCTEIIPSLYPWNP